MSEQYIERYWRDATPADAIREPPMVARFRFGEGYDWFIGSLTGIRCNNQYPWYSAKLGSYKHCQVYDAPDPGEGWRLIDPVKEEWQQGDEIYERSTGTWRIRLTPFQDWALSINRRRIEPPKPQPRYEPFRWEDREKLKGRWIAHNAGNLEVCPMSFFSTESNFFVGTQDAQKLLDHWHFMDTGEPVGRRVEQ